MEFLNIGKKNSSALLLNILMLNKGKNQFLSLLQQDLYHYIIIIFVGISWMCLMSMWRVVRGLIVLF